MLCPGYGLCYGLCLQPRRAMPWAWHGMQLASPSSGRVGTKLHFIICIPILCMLSVSGLEGGVAGSSTHIFSRDGLHDQGVGSTLLI